MTKVLQEIYHITLETEAQSLCQSANQQLQ